MKRAPTTERTRPSPSPKRAAQGRLCIQPTESPLVLAKPVMLAEKRGSPSASRILFDPFELNVAKRSLKKAGEVIPLAGGAFAILLGLFDRAVSVVTKSEPISN